MAVIECEGVDPQGAPYECGPYSDLYWLVDEKLYYYNVWAWRLEYIWGAMPKGWTPMCYVGVPVTYDLPDDEIPF